MPKKKWNRLNDDLSIDKEKRYRKRLRKMRRKLLYDADAEEDAYDNFYDPPKDKEHRANPS